MLKIDFQLGISREDALKTNIFPIDPARVIESFRKTGLKPALGVWLDRRIGCGCAIGAYIADQPELGCFDTLWEQRVCATFEPDGVLGYKKQNEFIVEFANAFDKPLEDIRLNLDDYINEPATLGFQILAWRNALAVRLALDEAGLTPVNYD